ncbi:MAG: hypothetical protein ACO1QB_09470 [Verrucomicrobiales bacterium]
MIKTKTISAKHEVSESYMNGASVTPQNRMELVYKVEGEQALFESERMILVFVDLPKDPRECFYLQGGKVNLQVSGEGSSTVHVECSNNKTVATFNASYHDGVNKITFCDSEALLVEHGKTVRGAETSAEEAGEKTMYIIKPKPLAKL